MKQVTKGTYQIEAEALGANLKAIKHTPIRPTSDAADIRKVWDYRAAGLKIDAAREYISKWVSRPYRPRPLQAETGRILHLQSSLQYARHERRRVIERIDHMPTLERDTKLSYTNTSVRWQVGDRTLITIRSESAEWSDRKSYRYPTHTEVSYTTYLLRSDWRAQYSVDELMQSATTSSISAIAEASVSHNARGNWWGRVSEQLLGVRYKMPKPSADTLIVTVADSISAGNCPDATERVRQMVGDACPAKALLQKMRAAGMTDLIPYARKAIAVARRRAA